MAILEVLKYPDPRLRKKAEPVTEVNEEIRELGQNMLETMYSFHGIGLSGPQVNRSQRILVADTRPKDENGRYSIEETTDLEQKVDQPLVLINPVIFNQQGKTTFDEGCLSIPSYYETVERADWIEVEGLNLNGEKVRFEVDGLLAICIQHEIDHLDGKLFIDRLSTIKANRLKSKIKKNGYPEPEEAPSAEGNDIVQQSLSKDSKKEKEPSL